MCLLTEEKVGGEINAPDYSGSPGMTDGRSVFDESPLLTMTTSTAMLMMILQFTATISSIRADTDTDEELRMDGRQRLQSSPCKINETFSANIMKF
jgi:hypothetical protein